MIVKEQHRRTAAPASDGWKAQRQPDEVMKEHRVRPEPVERTHERGLGARPYDRQQHLRPGRDVRDTEARHARQALAGEVFRRRITPAGEQHRDLVAAAQQFAHVTDGDPFRAEARLGHEVVEGDQDPHRPPSADMMTAGPVTGLLRAAAGCADRRGTTRSVRPWSVFGAAFGP